MHLLQRELAMRFTQTFLLLEVPGCGYPSVIWTVGRLLVCVTCLRIPRWRLLAGISSGGFLQLGEAVGEQGWIRAKIFIKARRYFLKANKLLKQKLHISLKLARQCVSGFGWFKNTNSYKIRAKLRIDEIHKICNEIISCHAKFERGVVNAVVI